VHILFFGDLGNTMTLDASSKPSHDFSAPNRVTERAQTENSRDKAGSD